MALSVLINGVEYNSNVFRDTLSIRESPQANGATMSAMVQLSGALTVPLTGQQIQVYRDGNIEFGGRIANVDHMYPYNANQYRIDCVDYTVDLDASLKSIDLEAGTASNQIRRIVGLVSRGFTTTNVEEGPLVGLQEIEHEAPSSIISRIAESVEYQWYVDYNRDVHFFYIRNRPAPVATIDFDTDVVNYSDLEFTSNGDQVKNVIYLTGAKVKSQNTDSIVSKADGDQTFWPLNYEPWSLEDTTVSVNGIPHAILLDQVDGFAGDSMQEDGVVLLCLDNWGVRFPDNSPPPADASIEIAYRYAYEPTIVVEDLDSIAYMRARENTASAPSDGRHEFKFNIPDLRVDDEQTIVDYGNLLLYRYAYPTYTLKFASKTQGWRAGQMFHGVSATRGLDTDIYITGVTKTIWQSSGGVLKFAYELEASSSPFPG